MATADLDTVRVMQHKLAGWLEMDISSILYDHSNH
jgi:hypothetical protein